MPTDHPIQHIAFIPDGNRRWAVSHKMQAIFGHRSGADVIREMYDWLVEYGIKYATFYTFSSENWKRPKIEVDYLLNLFRKLADDALEEFQEKGVRFRYIGDVTNFPEDIQSRLNELQSVTAKNGKVTLIIAIGYSGQNEIVRATKKIAEDVANKKLEISDIDESLFASYLDTRDIPPPDVIVRTSEQRISNFLLWQLAYSEIIFIDKYWPDFSKEDFDNVIAEFSHRVRRYGA